MAFEIPKQPYSGVIGITTLGKGDKSVTLGGEDSYPFHVFEGKVPNRPKIAMEVWDYDPSGEWPAAAIEPFKDVISSPDAWAKKCVDEYGADIIVLQLKSTDPNGMDRDPKEAAQVAKKVSDAIDVPLVFWGTANNQKDEEVLKLISEACQGKNVALGPVEEANHKGIGASALGYGHTIVASTPIDVNLAKQLNILLGNLGVKTDKIIVDPTSGGLGYGLEYSYSVMERIMMAALTQDDDKLMIPMINNVGNEVWKSKEAKLEIDEAQTLGDPERRGILMETVAAVCYLLGGSDVVIVRHPESARMISVFIDLMIDGGTSKDIPAIVKRLDMQTADLAAISPEPNLDFAESEPTPKAEPKKKAKAEAAAPKKPAPKPEKAEEKAAPKPAPAAAPAPKPEKKVEEAAVKVEAEAKIAAKQEVEAKAKAEAAAKQEAEAKAEAEAAAKQEAEAKAEAEKKAAADAAAKARAKREAEEQEQRLKRAEEREKLAEKRAQKAMEKEIPLTASEKQKTEQEKILDRLNWIHRRIPLY